MYAAIHRYDHVNGTPDELARSGRQLAALLSAEPGFLSAVLVQVAEGGVALIGLCDDEPSARQLSRVARQWLSEHLAGVMTDPAAVPVGEVLAQRGL